MSDTRPTNLKRGDKLYRVYDGIGPCEIEEVTVLKITPLKVWFTRSGGLSFQCRTGMEHPAAANCARTPKQAVEMFLKDEQESIAEATRAYEAAAKWGTKMLEELK